MIDYDALPQTVAEATPGPWEHAGGGQIGNYESRMIVAIVGGDETGEQIGDSSLEADRELVALAPELAAELLRLRDGVAGLRDEMADLHHAGRVYRGKKTDAVVPAHAIARRLNHLLERDSNGD